MNMSEYDPKQKKKKKLFDPVHALRLYLVYIVLNSSLIYFRTYLDTRLEYLFSLEINSNIINYHSIGARESEQFFKIVMKNKRYP